MRTGWTLCRQLCVVVALLVRGNAASDTAYAQAAAGKNYEPPSFLGWLEVRASGALLSCNPNDADKTVGQVYQCADLSGKGDPPGRGSKLAMGTFQEWVFIPAQLQGEWVYRIESRADGRCLEYPEEETPHPGSTVRVGQRKENAQNQLWRLVKCRNSPFYVLRAAVNPTVVVGVHRPGINENFTGVNLWHYQADPGFSGDPTHQEFLLRSQGPGPGAARQSGAATNTTKETVAFNCWLEVRASRGLISCNPSDASKPTGQVYQCADWSAYVPPPAPGSLLAMSTYQQWVFVTVKLDGAQFYRIESRADGRVLETPEGETPHPGTTVRAGLRKDNARNQLWRLDKCKGTPFYTLRCSIDPTLVVGVHRPAVNMNFTALNLWHYHGDPGHSGFSTHQQFLIRSQSPGPGASR
jgi:hypothetical protein